MVVRFSQANARARSNDRVQCKETNSWTSSTVQTNWILGAIKLGSEYERTSLLNYYYYWLTNGIVSTNWGIQYIYNFYHKNVQRCPEPYTHTRADALDLWAVLFCIVPCLRWLRSFERAWTVSTFFFFTFSAFLCFSFFNFIAWAVAHTSHTHTHNTHNFF